MIPCTNNCIYQSDGQCELSHAATGEPGFGSDCRYHVERHNSTALSNYAYEWFFRL